MNPAGMKEPFKVYMGKGKLWLLTGASLILIAMGAWLFSLYLKGEESILYAGVGVSGVYCILWGMPGVHRQKIVRSFPSGYTGCRVLRAGL
jgi:hypothetical protein